MVTSEPAEARPHTTGAAPSPSGHGVSVVIPTYNEAETVAGAVARVRSAVPDAEILVVDDDSPDGTWRIARSIAEDDGNIRVLRRTAARGLAPSVLEGFQAAAGPVLVVVDADGQHDETKIPDLVEAVIDGADIAVGSRAADGGGYGDWKWHRQLMSAVAARAGRMATGAPTTDPMSGFFAVHRNYVDEIASDLNPQGFKILLELLSRGRPVVAEVGYQFKNRVAGESKLDGRVIVAYLLALIDLRFGKVISTRFVKYGLVGASGVVVNFGSFAVARALGIAASTAVVVGILISIVWNFGLNNTWTFREHAYRGFAMLRGLVLFGIVSAYGLVIQLAVFRLVDDWSFVGDTLGQRLGEFVANLTGIAFAVVANYFLNMNYTWSRRARAGAEPVAEMAVATA